MGINHEFELACLRELLSYLEIEPVADVVEWHHPTEERTCDIRWRRHDVCPGPLYTSPQPAPVVPEDVRRALSIMDDEIIAELDAEEVACRAAMLQGGNSPVIPEGWALVPVDATRKMVDAAARVEEEGYDAMHKAMIAAAPQEVTSSSPIKK